MSNLTNTVETILLSFMVVGLTASVYMNWTQTNTIVQQQAQLSEQAQIIQFYATFCRATQSQPPEMLFPEDFNE